MTTQIKAFLLVILLIATACGKSSKVTVHGTFGGIENTPVYLEQVMVNQPNKIDTVVTNDKGRFKFTVSLPNQQPVFFNLRCNDQTIALLLSPGEKVEISSLGDLVHNYEIQGSEGSAQIHELNQILISSRRSLDSLARVYHNLDSQDTAVISTLNQYSRLYIRLKREMIGFVVNNATSLSSVYALYQRMPNGQWYFADEQDMAYFQMVADSLSARYPLSPHVVSLQNDVQKMRNRTELRSMLSNAPVSQLSYPDIELPDVFGNKIKLSSLDGNVILVDFWISTITESRIQNAELAEIYAAYHDQRFEIYQVSLDQAKLPWVTAIQDQKLPWVSVCDFKGLDSPAARIYNIKQLPANILINRQGEIVGRDIPVEQLGDYIRKLL